MSQACLLKLILPLRVALTKKGKSTFILNLNHYRNAHYFKLNTAKVLFKEQISNQIKELPHINSCELEYVLFPGSRIKCDISNVLSIVDKFFCDAVTELGIWEDDNYTIVKKVTYAFGGIDKDNPRAEVIIKPLEEDT